MEKNLDEYLDCKDYKGHPRSEQHPDFSTFEKDGEFYFAMLDEKDNVALRSEGYSSAKGRDNGIESVTKNREIEDRFKVIKIRGKYYLSLIAGNSQEIARSCPFASGGSAEKALLGGGKVAAAPKKRKKRRTTPKAEKVEVASGSYPCSSISYKIFKSGGNNKYYFTYRDKDDKAILISSNIRGYETLEETEAVIKAIAANGSKAGNFEERPTTNGKFYYYLKNDDGKNIGKSFFFDTEEGMRATMKLLDCGIAAGGASAPAAGAASLDRQDDDYMVCTAYEGHDIDGDGFSRFTNSGEFFFAMHGSDGSVKLRSERYTSESGRDNGIESVKKNRELSERYKIEEARNIFYVVLKAGNHQEIARSCPYTDRGVASSFIADPMGLAAAAATKAEQDDYLRCSEYKGHNVSSVHKDFAEFEQDGEFFFAWIGHNGEVVLRSERYQSVKARDNGIESVLKNRKDQGKWSVDEKMGYFFNVLKAGNHQEIGRSCPIKDKGAAGYNPTWFSGPLAAAVATGAAVVTTKAKQDDYLKCSEYKGQKRSSIHKDFVAFENDGEHLFAWIDKDGDVVLRSERYQSAKARDNGINSVLKNRKNKDRWSVDEKMGYYFSVLKAANHQEIGRSCPNKEKAAAGWNPLWFAAPAVAAVAAAVPPPPKKKKAGAGAAAAGAALAAGSGAASTSAAEGGSGFKIPWWLWLALVGLLLALLFWKGCFNCNTPAAVIDDTEVVTPAAPAPDATIAPAEVDGGTESTSDAEAGSGAASETAPVNAAVCNCNNQTHKVFKLPPANTPAKKLRRLGTNPEFGNSHSLDGAGFYNKLKQRHTASGTDKRFLDGIFKAMGYNNGFTDASAGLFTEVELPRNTKGNLGYGRKHGTGYYTLPDAIRDRQAFKIEAANGCHLHFMKTCGNHMFFCPN